MSALEPSPVANPRVRALKEAVKYFAMAVKADPISEVKKSNLASAYVEIDAYGLAIDLLKKINNGTDDRLFRLGRAYLYNGNFAQAINNLKPVNTYYWNGAARMLEAAALVGIARTTQDNLEKDRLISEYEKLFRAGYAVNTNYWDDQFSRRNPDIHIRYRILLKMTSDIYEKIKQSDS